MRCYTVSAPRALVSIGIVKGGSVVLSANVFLFDYFFNPEFLGFMLILPQIQATQRTV